MCLALYGPHHGLMGATLAYTISTYPILSLLGAPPARSDMLSIVFDVNIAPSLPVIQFAFDNYATFCDGSYTRRTTRTQCSERTSSRLDAVVFANVMTLRSGCLPAAPSTRPLRGAPTPGKAPASEAALIRSGMIRVSVAAVFHAVLQDLWACCHCVCGGLHNHCFDSLSSSMACITTQVVMLETSRTWLSGNVQIGRFRMNPVSDLADDPNSAF
jgi:hypothetical protein